MVGLLVQALAQTLLTAPVHHPGVLGVELAVEARRLSLRAADDSQRERTGVRPSDLL
ncbi:MAG: hypothetical protein ACR2OB_08470 [Solirubrobacteraceae bacterium]